MSLAGLRWVCQSFDALDGAALYQIMRLRQEVFVVEQTCAFLDADGWDLHAWHLTGWAGEHLLAYARIFEPAVVREEASIGRVVSAPSHRQQGLGISLMDQAVEKVRSFGPGVPVWIGAQERLCRFYAGFGFAETGERYLEDGIWHRGMQATTDQLGRHPVV